MTYEIYRYIFIGGLVLSVLMLILSVVLFFTMNVRKLIGEYNGTTKRKAIEKIRKRSSGEVAVTGGVTPKAKSSKPAAVKVQDDVDTNATDKIKPQDRYDNFEASETSTLSEYNNHHTADNTPAPAAVSYARNSYAVRDDFVIETDITIVHSSEVIR